MIWLNKMLAGIYSVLLKGGKEKPTFFTSLIARGCLSVPFILSIFLLVMIIASLTSIDLQYKIPSGRPMSVLYIVITSSIIYIFTGGNENFARIIEQEPTEQLEVYNRNWYYLSITMIVVFVLTGLLIG